MVYETLAGKLLANRKKQTHRQNKRAQKYKQTMEKFIQLTTSCEFSFAQKRFIVCEIIVIIKTISYFQPVGQKKCNTGNIHPLLFNKYETFHY